MPFFAKALGQAGKTAEEVERIVERFENPAIQAVGTTGNIAGSVPKPDTEPPATDVTPSGSPMAYLTGNLETLESHVQAMEHAFAGRAEALAKAPGRAGGSLRRRGAGEDLRRSGSKWLSVQEPYQGLHEPLRIVEPGKVPAARLHGQVGPAEQAGIRSGALRGERDVVLARDEERPRPEAGDGGPGGVRIEGTGRVVDRRRVRVRLARLLGEVGLADGVPPAVGERCDRRPPSGRGVARPDPLERGEGIREPGLPPAM